MEGQATVKEVGEEKVQTLNIVTWKEPIEVASKILLISVGVSYVVGLFILNFHLREYGVFYLNFLQIEYVMTGALWAFLCGMGYCYYYKFIKPSKPVLTAQKTKTEKWVAIVKFLFSIIGAIFAGNFVFSYLMGQLGKYLFINYRTLLMSTVVWFNVAYLIKVSNMGRSLLKSYNKQESKEERHGRIYNILDTLIFSLIGLSVYASFVYPKILPVYGGGAKQKAQIIVKVDQVDAVKHMGISVEDETHSMNAVDILFEASDFLIIRAVCD